MVSFSCEACGDVITKKKLDPHHRQCQGSSFTCLDCMTHFRGTEYRTHTSCVSEEQKYQGALYKEKPSKKSVKISEPKQRPRSAYVEDAPDVDSTNAITIADAPPAAPSPPTARHSQPAPPAQPINVFDFLVTADTPKATPNASKVSLGGSNEGMKMVEHAPKVFSGRGLQDAKEQASRREDQDAYAQHGYSYGEDPVHVKKEAPRIEYITPGPKTRRNENQNPSYYADDSQRKSTDKKRKRAHVEELDLTAARPPSQESDAHADAPPAVLHSGLTGGLNRLLSKSTFPPSPDYSNGDPSPPSPAKRSKHTVKERDEGLSRGRNGVLVKVRKRRPSDESRPRKQHRSHHSPEHHKQDVRPKQKAIGDRPKRKAVEYHSQTQAVDSQQQLVVFKSRAELFMSFVTKGPGSEQGYSVHKALKRYHRERGEQGLGLEKVDEEKELFKNLRLKRNDRGEVVVFFS